MSQQPHESVPSEIYEELTPETRANPNTLRQDALNRHIASRAALAADLHAGTLSPDEEKAAFDLLAADVIHG